MARRTSEQMVSFLEEKLDKAVSGRKQADFRVERCQAELRKARERIEIRHQLEEADRTHRNLRERIRAGSLMSSGEETSVCRPKEGKRQEV